LNPFVLARLEMVSPRPAEEALGALDRLVAEGVDVDGRHYRLFGGRRGGYFSMSLGMPILGGGAPVLRARLAETGGETRFDVSVGARMEMIVLGAFWALLTVIGGGYQILLQLIAVASGRANAQAVIEVLPGIGIMAGLLLLGAWIFRRRGASHARFLLGCLQQALGTRPGGGAATAVSPIH
jgi:hypothetical protein